MCDFYHSWITKQPILVRGPLYRDANNNETVLFTRPFAFVPYLHNSGEFNMICPIGDEANRCRFWTCSTGVMETSFLVHNAYLWKQFAYLHENVRWTSSAHRYGKYTENIIFRVFLV